MFSRILVAYDGSNGGAAGLAKAAALARLSGAELNVLTVFRHHSMLEASFAYHPPGETGNTDDVMREYAEGVAQDGRRLATEAGVEDVRAFVKAGQPARSIVAFAKEHDADLIVVGSRGLGSVEGFLLGSVSHKVTGLSQCPVLVV